MTTGETRPSHTGPGRFSSAWPALVSTIRVLGATLRKTVGWLRAGFPTDTAAATLLPLAIALPTFWWFWTNLRVAAVTAAGRDQGIFQFIAWSMGKGERLYRDIHDVSGPLTAYIHLFIQRIAGGSEVALRVSDLLVSSLVYVAAGALFVGCVLRQPRPGRRIAQRVGWGLAAWVTLGTQYLGAFDYWMITQRETFGDWFVISGIALQLWAQARDAQSTPTGRVGVALATAAGLSVTSWFCKPTFFLFTVAQGLALVLDDEMQSTVARRLRSFLAGSIAAGAIQLVLLLIYGDVVGYVRTMFSDVPRIFIYLWPQPLLDLFAGPWRNLFGLGIALAVLYTVLILAKEFPRRSLGLALSPLAAIASVLIQRKGTAYHYQPLLLFVYLQLLFGCLWLAERFLVSPDSSAVPSDAWRPRTFERLLAIAAAAALGLMGMDDATKSYYFKNRDLIAVYRSQSYTLGDAYLRRFDNGSYSRGDLELGGRYLREHVPENGRVFYWGIDPYLLYLGQRLSASTYTSSYFFNPTGVLAGGPDLKPSEARKTEIKALWAANAREMAEQVKARPPAALAIMDGIYWGPDGLADFKKWCPDAAAFFEPRYQEVTRFGKVRIFLPR